MESIVWFRISNNISDILLITFLYPFNKISLLDSLNECFLECKPHKYYINQEDKRQRMKYQIGKALHLRFIYPTAQSLYPILYHRSELLNLSVSSIACFALIIFQVQNIDIQSP